MKQIRPVIILILLILLNSLSISADKPQGIQSSYQRNLRTLIDNERGGFFIYPFNDEWDGLAAAFGLPDYDYELLSPQAIKGIHARLQHFERVGPRNLSAFPSAEMKLYELDEIKQGRDPIWVTATSQNQKARLFIQNKKAWLFKLFTIYW